MNKNEYQQSNRVKEMTYCNIHTKTAFFFFHLSTVKRFGKNVITILHCPEVICVSDLCGFRHVSLYCRITVTCLPPRMNHI